jgi:hypothetical protein
MTMRPRLPFATIALVSAWTATAALSLAATPAQATPD